MSGSGRFYCRWDCKVCLDCVFLVYTGSTVLILMLLFFVFYINLQEASEDVKKNLWTTRIAFELVRQNKVK